jgi:hypothetical protein
MIDTWPGSPRCPLHPTVELREVDARGAQTRGRFKFDRPIEDPGLTFRCWNGSDFVTWTQPPVESRLQLSAAKAL